MPIDPVAWLKTFAGLSRDDMVQTLMEDGSGAVMIGKALRSLLAPSPAASALERQSERIAREIVKFTEDTCHGCPHPAHPQRCQGLDMFYPPGCTCQERAAPSPAGAAPHTAMLIEAGQACVDWFKDTGDCHFCNPDENDGKHDEECPLRTTPSPPPSHP